MTKRFCDICNVNETEDPPNRSLSLTIFPSTISEACKIQVHVLASFVNHPTGFGGPPDICIDCKKKTAETVLRKIINAPTTD